MKTKLASAVALSHDSELLILDETTSGLDPIVRDDILDMLLGFVQDENHSILVSSHITSDLEKIADYIVLSLLGTVAALIPCGVLALLGFEMEAGSLCLYGSMGISASLLAGSIGLPCAYCFDSDRSQIVFMLSFMASTAVIFALVMLINLFIPVHENTFPAFGIVLAVSVVFFLVSNRIGVWMFRRKEVF